MVSPETGEATLACPLNTVSCHMTRPDFGDQKYAIALAPQLRG